MFCPKCKYEYIEGVKTCSTCGADLVNELPKQVEKSYEYVELVTLLLTNPNLPPETSVFLELKFIKAAGN